MTKSKTVLEIPYARALHEAPTPVMLVLERMYIFQLLSAEIYICLFNHACWLYCPSHMYFWIFCLLDLLIIERDVLKYYTMIIQHFSTEPPYLSFCLSPKHPTSISVLHFDFNFLGDSLVMESGVSCDWNFPYLSTPVCTTLKICFI